MLATPGGLILDFVIYQGATTWIDGKPSSTLGVGGTVVKMLTERVPSGHVVHFDRFFTTIPLIDSLLDGGILSVGTILANRLPNTVKSKLRRNKDLKKSGRGSFDEIVREDEKVCVLKWFDNTTFS